MNELIPSQGEDIPSLVHFLAIGKVVEDEIKARTNEARAELRKKIEAVEEASGLDSFVAKSQYGKAQVTDPTPKLFVEDRDAFVAWCQDKELAGELRMQRVPQFLAGLDREVVADTVEAFLAGGDPADLREMIEVVEEWSIPADFIAALPKQIPFSWGDGSHNSRPKWADLDSGELEEIPGLLITITARQLRVSFDKDAKKELRETLSIHTKELTE